MKKTTRLRNRIEAENRIERKIGREGNNMSIKSCILLRKRKTTKKREMILGITNRKIQLR